MQLPKFIYEYLNVVPVEQHEELIAKYNTLKFKTQDMERDLNSLLVEIEKQAPRIKELENQLENASRTNATIMCALNNEELDKVQKAIENNRKIVGAEHKHKSKYQEYKEKQMGIEYEDIENMEGDK